VPEVGDKRREDLDRVVGAPRGAVRVGEVVAAAERAGVLGAEDPLEIGDQRLEDLGSIESACGKPG